MSSFKKFAWSGAAVAFALVMALGLMARPASAVIALSPLDATIALTTNATNGTQAFSALPTPAAFDCTATADCPNSGVLVLTAPTGWQLGGTVTAGVMANGACVAVIVPLGGTLATVVTAADNSTITITLAAGGGATTAGDDLCINGVTARPISNTSATGNITAGTGTTAAVAAVGQVLGTLTAGTALTANTTWTLVLTAPTTTLPADGSNSTTITATVRDGNAAPVSGICLSWTVSVGILGVGTAKTATSCTAAAGTTTQTYRGAGGNVATDTIIATNSANNLVGTLTMNLVAGTGTTANKIQIIAPVTLAIAPTVTNTSPGYQSPTTATNAAVEVLDSAGSGVNGQVVLITIDKGALVDGLGGACAGVTAKSITPTTASEAQVTGGTVKSGTIGFTICANQLDSAGKSTVTAQNITTSMANATTSLSHAGRPAKVEATASGNNVSVKVTDAGGNVVADGTPVRFAIGAFAGALTSACGGTTNGVAQTTAALTQASGTVAVSVDWNETGAASTCATGAGSQQIGASVGVPSGSTSAGGGTPAAGTITSGSIPAAGGFGLIVYGGPVTALVTASGCPAASAAFWATIAGNFVTYVPGTTISAVNADFLAAFPSGIPAGTPLIGKCK